MKKAFTLIELLACQPTRPAELERSWKPWRRQVKSAFTLIELLVVIAIIGILASVVVVNVGSGRTKARDAKRISDLKAVQTALEMYYDQYNFYPSSQTMQDNCTNNNMGSNISELATALSPYLSSYPTDPLNTGINTYAYCSDKTSGSNEYIIGAQLENASNPALTSDFDGIFYTNGAGYRELHSNDTASFSHDDPIWAARSFTLAKCEETSSEGLNNDSSTKINGNCGTY